jgi:hypothetical protein
MTNTKFIKVLKADNDYFETRINGEEKEIVEYYNQYNLLCDNKENTQVKEIEFYYNDGGFSGTQLRKVVYPFVFINEKNLYQY